MKADAKVFSAACRCRTKPCPKITPETGLINLGIKPKSYILDQWHHVNVIVRQQSKSILRQKNCKLINLRCPNNTVFKEMWIEVSSFSLRLTVNSQKNLLACVLDLWTDNMNLSCSDLHRISFESWRRFRQINQCSSSDPCHCTGLSILWLQSYDLLLKTSVSFSAIQDQERAAECWLCTF